jgi:hypothetical protein
MDIEQIIDEAWESLPARHRALLETVGAAGRRLLELCPAGIREDVCTAGYGAREYTHEIVAAVYAVMMRRRARGQSAQPPWLEKEIYALFQKLTDWER